MYSFWKVVIFYSFIFIVLISSGIQNSLTKAIIGAYIIAHLIFGPLDWYFLIAKCDRTLTKLCILPICKMKIKCPYVNDGKLIGLKK